MFYDFPTICNIEDVLPAIEGCPEFIVAKRDEYQIVNYNVVMPDTFPEVKTVNDAIRRECRGLMFDLDGNIIARRLHKFFNVNEREETQSRRIDITRPHHILEKLDGSMVTPIPIYQDGEYRFRWGTKMGVTDVAMSAECFVVDNPRYEAFAKHCHVHGTTPIFEFCSRKHRIVIDHPKERLVLIALRNVHTGKYETYVNMVDAADDFDIEVVQHYPGTMETMEQLINDVRETEDFEGYVLRYDNGHMVKIKSEWYVRLHKTKDAMRFERKVVKMILDETLDDQKAFMFDEDRVRVDAFTEDFWRAFNAYSFDLFTETASVRDSGVDRKTFALEIAPKLHSVLKNFIFQTWDNCEYGYDDAQVYFKTKLYKVLNNNTKYDKFKAEIPELARIKWDETLI